MKNNMGSSGAKAAAGLNNVLITVLLTRIIPAFNDKSADLIYWEQLLDKEVIKTMQCWIKSGPTGSSDNQVDR